MAGVIATPLVHRFDINAADPEDPEADGDRFAILASDGVWEFIDSEAACGIVAAHGRSNRGAVDSWGVRGASAGGGAALEARDQHLPRRHNCDRGAPSRHGDGRGEAEGLGAGALPTV